MFGFGRLAESLGRHAHAARRPRRAASSPTSRLFTRRAPREDDVTVLAARLPD